MKRKIILSLITAIAITTTLSFVSFNKAEELAGTDKYKVIKVDGKIIFQKTKEDMKKGDIFLSGMALSFETPQSRAAVISALKGRFVLSASEKGQTKILPAANNISSRAGALINMIDLQNHFSGKYLVIGEMRLELGEEAFPMNDDSFFYLSYYHNEEKINKKLDSDGAFLILNKEEIYKIDGEPIPVEEKEMTLYYMSDGKNQKVSTFTPVFPDLNDLKEEVEIILSEYEDKDNETKIKEVTAYLNEFYGHPQKDNLGVWMEEEFDIK
ncbi:MAG: hypothetical protein HUJ25_08240 [Crocinitomicaceae bacterium]|nr:hypothetical protein [Crocinitomicaceae bacterium]